jgi:hypothetical protein
VLGVLRREDPRLVPRSCASGCQVPTETRHAAGIGRKLVSQKKDFL